MYRWSGHSVLEENWCTSGRTSAPRKKILTLSCTLAPQAQGSYNATGNLLKDRSAPPSTYHTLRYSNDAHSNEMNNHSLGITFLLASILTVGHQTALAKQERTRTTGHDLFQKYVEDKNRKNFAGWEAVLFYCWPGSKEEDESLKEICERSFVNSRFLAAAAKIKLEKATGMQQIGFESALGARLILMIDLTATTGTRLPKAIAVNLRAYSSYSGPITTIDDSNEEPQERTQVRSGDLIFWERGGIAVGWNGQELESPLSEAIDLLLKEFFSDYLNAQR